MVSRRSTNNSVVRCTKGTNCQFISDFFFVGFPSKKILELKTVGRGERGRALTVYLFLRGEWVLCVKISSFFLKISETTIATL